MHTKAEIATQAVKAATIAGTGVTSLAWWNTNSSAITAICAFGTFIVVMVTAIINWHYKYKQMETIMAEDKRPPKKENKPTPEEPTPGTESVPCTDPNNPCDND